MAAMTVLAIGIRQSWLTQSQITHIHENKVLSWQQ